MSETSYFLAREGQTYGPYPASSIQEMMQTGEITEDDQICEQGANDWHTAAEVFAPPPQVTIPSVKAPVPPQAEPVQPAVSGAMVDAADKRYRGKLVAAILSLMLAVMPWVASLDAKGRSAQQMLREDAHGRDSGKKALAIILSRWWPVTMVIGAAGVILFVRQATRSRKELKSLSALMKRQSAGGQQQRPAGKPAKRKR